MDRPIFYKAERFFPNKEYEEFSKILSRNEIVTFDFLCRNIENEGIDYTEYLADCNYGVLDWKVLLIIPLESDEQIIACFKNPTESHEFHYLDSRFEFCGYDLSNDDVFISAITHCDGGFANALPYESLNKYGLIDNHQKAIYCSNFLKMSYPDEPHAYCEVFELWRML